MAKIPEIERRLLNWARYVSTLGAPPPAPDPTAPRVDGSGWDAPTVIPTNDAEAEQTGRAVAALEPELQRTVGVYYLQGGFLTSKLRQLGLQHRVTLYARIGRAHRILLRWFADDAAVKQRERERVEALQRSAGHALAAVAPPAAPVERNVGGSVLAEILATSRAKRQRGGGFTI